MPELGVACGQCGGVVYMLTCNHFFATGHDWTLVSICASCRSVHWIESGCSDCNAQVAQELGVEHDNPLRLALLDLATDLARDEAMDDVGDRLEGIITEHLPEPYDHDRDGGVDE